MAYLLGFSVLAAPVRRDVRPEGGVTERDGGGKIIAIGGSLVARVCVLAYNSVQHDARVLKEADSLAKAGHEVTIIGFGDKRAPAGDYDRPSGVVVSLLKRRGGWLSVGNPLLRGLAVRGGAAVTVSAFVLSVVLVVDLLASRVWLIVPLGLLGGILLVYWRGRLVSCLKRLGSSYRRLLSWGGLRVARLLGHQTKQRILGDAAAELQPEIIHCHDLMTLPAGHRARRKCGAKLVWDAHEIYEEVAQSDEATRRRNRRLLWANQTGVDAFITINASIAAFYAQNYKALPPAVIVKNATLPIRRVVYDGRLHDAAQLPRDQRIVLYQGGFAEKRGLRNLVAAARHLDPSWTLVMMGWGGLENTLREIAADVAAGTPERERLAVAFVQAAPQAELPLWTAGAEVGLIPYEKTGLNHLYCTPNKLWEYPNADVPILCSPLVEMSKVIQEHRVGWLLPEEATPQAIAARINALGAEELKSARAACQAYIAADNWSVYERRLLALYEDLSGPTGINAAPYSESRLPAA